MPKRLNWGIWATGWVAQRFAKDLVEAGHTVLAVGSRQQQRAESFANQLGIERAYGGYDALLADADVDIIYIATPHTHHAENALRALEAGKHVLVEKPFTLNGAQAADVVASARARRLVVMEAMWTRFLPHMIWLRSRITEGLIGRVMALEANHLQLLPSDPAHRLNNLELGGGALLDLGIYPLSFAFDLLGEPISVKAEARFTKTGVDAAVAVVCQHQGGALSTSISALDLPGRNGANVIGTKGSVTIEGYWYAPASCKVYDQDGHLVEVFEQDVPGRGMQYQAVEMERLVRSAPGAESELMPPAQSVAIMKVLDEIRQQIGLRYP